MMLMFGAFEAVSILMCQVVFEFDVMVTEQNAMLFKSIFPTSLEKFAPSLELIYQCDIHMWMFQFFLRVLSEKLEHAKSN